MQVTVKAQVKIGDDPTNVNSASLLELASINKGLALPQVGLTGLNSPSPLAAGLLPGTVVFNTNSGIGSGVGVYYWNGNAWVSAGSGGSVLAWSLTGNNGTDPAINFLGTTDAQVFVLRTNNIERIRILGTGNIGIGTTLPSNALSIIATDPLYLSGVQATSTLNTDSVLIINAGIVKKAPVSNLTGGGGSGWLLIGNSGTSSSNNFVGTTDDRALVFRVNNTQAGFLGSQNDGQGKTSFGYSANAGDQSATAIGREALASANTASAFGYLAKATSQFSVALGTTSTASGTSSAAIGQNSIASAQNAVAIGNGAAASGSVDNIAIGTGAAASVQQGIAIGPFATATQNLTAMALGYRANAGGGSSSAIGDNATATGSNSLALGVRALASHNAAIAVGNGSEASGDNATAYGSGSRATNNGANAFGNSSVASGFNSTTLGNNSVASGPQALAVGDASIAEGNRAIVLGNGSAARGINTIVIGAEINAIQDNALILGNAQNNVAIGTTTPNTSTKLDVSGSFKLGPLGTVIGNIVKTTTTLANDLVIPRFGSTSIPFTGIGLLPGATVIINPRSPLPDAIAIAYSYVSAADTLTINFVTNDNTDVTIPAGTTFDIAIIQ